jgi:hypothetical protein
MTCVVGLVSESGYGYIGADSYAGDSNGLYSLTATPKVAKIGRMLIGFAGDFGQGERAVASLRRCQSIKTFASTIRKLDLNEVELLVIEGGRIYEICQGAVIETLSRRGRNYGAVGSGAPTALGALYVDSIDKSSITRALRASEAHCNSVRAPFTVLELESDE